MIIFTRYINPTQCSGLSLLLSTQGVHDRKYLVIIDFFVMSLHILILEQTYGRADRQRYKGESVTLKIRVDQKII